MRTPGRLALTTLGLCCAVLLTVPMGAQEWTARFGGDFADLGYDAQPTADGGAVAVGFSSVQSWQDAYVVRTDDLGQKLWDRSLSLSNLGEAAYNAIPTNDGGVVVVASVDLANSPDYRPWVLKLDAHGSTLWSTATSVTAHLPVDSGYVRGAELSGGNLAVVGGSNSYTNPEDPWVLLLDPHGTEIVFEQLTPLGEPGFGNSTYVNSIAPTADGGFVLTGYISIGTGVGYLWKFDAHGDPEWSRLYQPEAFAVGNSVRPLTDGGYAVVGCRLPNCTDTRVLRTDNHGAPVWAQTYASPDGMYTNGRDVVERSGGALLVLQNRFGAFGARSYASDLLELDAHGTLVSTENLAVGAESTFLLALQSAGSDGSVLLTGNVNDTRNPSDTDLVVLRRQRGSAPLEPIFRDGFESGGYSSWSWASAQ